MAALHASLLPFSLINSKSTLIGAGVLPCQALLIRAIVKENKSPLMLMDVCVCVWYMDATGGALVGLEPRTTCHLDSCFGESTLPVL
jgi:hypothetical protein